MKNKVDQIVSITDNSRDYLQAIYLDWRNNFMTKDRFCEYYGFTENEVDELLKLASKVHSERTEG